MARIDHQLSRRITGMCLVNTNVPLAEHTHICGTKESHREHRCHCGVTWPVGTGARREVFHGRP
jgi:hypothetical protein